MSPSEDESQQCMYHLKLVSAFLLSRLNYCNAVLAGLPQSTIAPLQRAQNVAARLVTGIGFPEPVTPALHQLHWLPVQYHITFKLCLLIHKIHNKQAPSYLSDKVTTNADLWSCAGLRSVSTKKYQIPRTRTKFGKRSFSYAGPAAWNTTTLCSWYNWLCHFQKTP